jgi:hypothetical protein
MCVKNPNPVIARIASNAVGAWPKTIKPMPSQARNADKRIVRPLMPPERATRSLKMPPSARAKSARPPKMPAASPALTSVNP